MEVTDKTGRKCMNATRQKNSEEYVTEEECKERHSSNKSSARLAISLIVAFLVVVGMCMTIAGTAEVRSQKNEVKIESMSDVLQEMKADQRQGFTEIKQELRDMRTSLGNGS